MKQPLVSLGLIAFILLAACSPSTEAPSSSTSPSPQPTSVEAAAFPVTVEDGSGALVTVEAEPQRIVSLAPSHTETLYALGIGDRVVGVTEYCNYPPEVEEKRQVGGFSNIDLEQVVGLAPDLVLATHLHATEVVPALRERGLTVFVNQPQTVQEVLDGVLLVGRLSGQEDTAQELVDGMEERIARVQETVADADRPKVFWELGPELYTAGPGSFIDSLITAAGGENVAADADSPWPQLTVETIILKDPDVVVLADHNYGETAEKVQERPGWDQIRAVQEGRIVEITNDDIVSRPGPRIVEGLEFLARHLHPDLFE